MARAMDTPLMGRDADLAALEEALDYAAQGTGSVVLVSGGAGMGKTRLALEFVCRARSGGAVALWGACSEFDLSLPFLPFNEAIGTYLATADVAQLRQQIGPLADAVTKIVPQLSSGSPESDDLSEAGARLRLFEGVVAVLRAVATSAQSGGVLVVDDIQWADASTRELLDFVARRLRQLPLLLVMTYRRVEVGSSHPLHVALDGWRRAGLASTLALRPLTAAEVGRLVCARLGVDRVSHGLVDLMVKRTEGVPFAVEEVLEGAIGSGHIYERDGVWLSKPLSRFDLPESLSAGILQRLDRLDPDHRYVVIAAAILGRKFDPRLLQELTGLPAHVVSAALAAAAKAQFLESDPEDRTRLRFHHALHHEAICGAAPVWDAIDLHSRVADVISRTVPPAPAIERSRHLLAAGRTAEAAPLCAEAANTAAQAGAFAEAAALYEHALAGISDPAERGRLLFERGRMLVACGSPEAAITPLKEGVALAGDGPHAAAPKYLVTLGGAYWLVGDHRASFEAYERARELLESIPSSPDLALVYARLAMWHSSDFDCGAGLDMADRALALADHFDAEHARVPALIYRGAALCELGRRDEGLAVIDRGTAEAVRLMLPEDIGSGIMISAALRAFAMRAQELPPLAGFLRAADLGPASEVFALFVEALAGRFLGDVAQTEVVALAMVESAESLGAGLVAFLGREFLAWARLEQGRLDDAEALMEDLTLREGMWHRFWGPSRILLARARGDLDRAAAEAKLLLARVPTVVGDPFVTGIVAPVLLAVGAEEEADRCVAAALGPDRHAMAVGAAADLAAHRGDTATAAALYREALEGASSAGYRLYATEYEKRLAGLATEPPAAAAPAPEPDRPSRLSPREQQLLTLLANGMTDQQIAQNLCVSVRTVHSHLDRIRDKTGRRRRPELMLLAMELGLRDG